MLATKDVAKCVGCGKPVVFDYGQTQRNHGLIHCPHCNSYFSLRDSILEARGLVDFGELEGSEEDEDG